MKVKIGQKIYDSENQPIMLIFEDDDDRKRHAKNILNMPDANKTRKYCLFKTDDYNTEEKLEIIKKFMEL